MDFDPQPTRGPRRAGGTSRRARRQRGAVAIEMGILLPFIVLVILALIEFGSVYRAQITLQGAVREGARALAVSADDPVGATQAAAGDLEVEVETSGDSCDLGDDVTVTATHDYDSFGFGLFFDALENGILWIPGVDDFDRPGQLTATGVMRCERRE